MPGLGGDFEPPPRRPRWWLRFTIAALVIVVTSAAATAASALIYLNEIASQLGVIPGVRRVLLPAEEGGPQTFLILGSDKRASEHGTIGLSDTVILVRIDPNQHRIAMLSIPRDLKVNIPGHGINKFNAAYTYGGPKLTTEMVKQVTGVVPNHVVDIDFLGFARAVDAIGCVYVQVDQRYYHSNVGVPPSEQYSEINIEPGYQKLCGTKALEYVRYRHTDSDLVREARQQDFLREARAEIPASKIFFEEREKLLEIFTHYTSSDIHSGEELLGVLKLFVAARGSQVEQIHFPAILEPVVEGQPDYVTAEPAAVHAVVEKFLGVKGSGASRPGGEGGRPTSAGGGAPGAKAKPSHRKAKAKVTAAAGASAGLAEDATVGREQAVTLAGRLKPGFPLFYLKQLPAGTTYVDSRAYTLAIDGKRRGAYVEVMQEPATGYYFDLQGIAGWSDPPILSSPTETRSVGAHQAEIYTDAGKIRLIAWHDHGNSYWISNNLLQTLSNRQMLGMAASAATLR